MLTKLIRHDLKSVNRLLIIIHLALLAGSLLIRVFLTSGIHFEEASYDPRTNNILILAYVLMLILFVPVSLSAYLVFGARFYRNLFQDEGYLTLTLPVRRGAHLLSKTISGTLWATADIILLLLSFFLILWTPDMQQLFADNRADLFQFFGIGTALPPAAYVLILTVFTLVCCFFNIMQVYVSITAGQLFSSHRLLWAVVIYFVTNVILSLFQGILIIACCGVPIFRQMSGMHVTGFHPMDFSAAVLLSTGISSVVFGALLYAAAWFILDKKIDLA